MLREFVAKLIRGESLSQEESYVAGKAMISGADPHQVAAFLTLLSARGETADEILGLLQAVREKSKRIELDFPILDIVGTGGDGAGTVNISTGSALLASMHGVPVLKHGNRAVSSQCGSADVLEALGHDIHTLNHLQPSGGFAFCFAPDYHPALQTVRAIRKALQVPTAFHFMGPLLNPAGTDHMMIGVYDPKKVDLIAEVLFRLGTKKSLVFHGHGMDELSCIGPMRAILVTDQGKEEMIIDPIALGLKTCSLDDLKGKDAAYNANAIREALTRRTPLTDTLVLNAGIALFLYGKVATIEAGIAKVRKRSLKASLKRGVIAEIKRASPSAGAIAPIEDPVKRAKEYQAAGAVALSVLTHEAFNGSIEDLKKVAAAVDIPVLCKDFLVEPEQIVRAAKAGADAVLLIVARLHEKTAVFVELAHSLGLEALVEVHAESELEVALASNADIIGVNQRDLRDFTMHPEVFAKMVGKIPQVKIAESGIGSMAQAEELFALGYDGVLVGEALSRCEHPAEFFEGAYAR